MVTENNAISVTICLLFLIKYNNNVNHEVAWKTWIESGNSIMPFFHYNPDLPVTSSWIHAHLLPSNLIRETSYKHVIPAYMSLLAYAIRMCPNAKWFIFVTESCIPIISPLKFNNLFEQYSEKSIMRWTKCWWNPAYTKRANLHKLPERYHLGHDPWFILCRKDANLCIDFIRNPQTNSIFRTICDGPIGNESLFAIILEYNGCLHEVMNATTHAADWSRRASPTSPHVFNVVTSNDYVRFVNTFIESGNYLTCFLRKVRN